jgi:hypothetical protein
MNTSRFQRRTLKKTIELLCRLQNAQSDGSFLLKKNGEVNQTNLGRKSKVDQSVISRALQRVSQEITGENAKKLADFFKVSTSQLRGEEPIEVIDGVAPASGSDSFIDDYRRAPDEVKKAVREQYRIAMSLLAGAKAEQPPVLSAKAQAKHSRRPENRSDQSQD